jgi:hypothetical protein
MATVTVTDSRIHVELGRWEQLGGFQRSFSIPRASVREAHVADDPLRAVHGLRLPGTGLPGVLALGHFRSRASGHTFAAAYRGRPALVLELTGAQFDRLVISTEVPAQISAQLPAFA